MAVVMLFRTTRRHFGTVKPVTLWFASPSTLLRIAPAANPTIATLHMSRKGYLCAPPSQRTKHTKHTKAAVTHDWRIDRRLPKKAISPPSTNSMVVRRIAMNRGILTAASAINPTPTLAKYTKPCGTELPQAENAPPHSA